MRREIHEKVRECEQEVAAQVGKPKLSVELVPKSCWCSNIRTLVEPEDWDVLRKATYGHYGHVCAICGERGPKWPVECHEVWQYLIRPKASTQKLRYLVALCPSCHEVKHFGRSVAVGNEDRALTHLRKINKWSKKKAESYINQVFQIWRLRSEIENWQLDLSWATKRFGNIISLERKNS